MKTLNELLALAKQGKLDEIDTLCALAQGWARSDAIVPKTNLHFNLPFWHDNSGQYMCFMSEYHPTRDTEAGRSQAWQLMVKYKINYSPLIDGSDDIQAWGKGGLDVYHKNPQVAVAIAAILVAQGEG